MKFLSVILSAISFAAFAAFAPLTAANAAEIKIFTSRAIATVLEVVGPEFERTSGHKLNIMSGFSPNFVKQIRAGEPFDVVVSPPATIDGLVKSGHVLPETVASLVRSGIGVGVRAGGPKPDVSTVEAFKRALLNAKSIVYLPTGAVPQLIERLGIADAIKSKVTNPSSDIGSELVSKGEIELVVVVITQILTTPGVELAGALPPEIQVYAVFAAGISANSKVPDAAQSLIRFLRGPSVIPVIRSQGMEPT
jgi:molybdate transport system substrate-binding protein